jgi:hypothetical protein
MKDSYVWYDNIGRMITSFQVPYTFANGYNIIRNTIIALTFTCYIIHYCINIIIECCILNVLIIQFLFILWYYINGY